MENKNLTATLPQSTWSIISEALANMPYGKVAALVAELNRQFSEQLKEDKDV